MASGTISDEITKLLGCSYEEHMARQVNHTALDHLIADEHKHQPYLVSLLDSPTLLDEPWKPTSTTGMDVMSEMPVSPLLHKKRLIQCCKNIRLRPYSPNVWISRADTLLCLGYGELAVGDAYKGRLLIETFKKQTKTPGMPENGSLPWLIWKDMLADIPAEAKDGEDFALGFRAAFERLEEQAFLVMAQGLFAIRACYDAVQVIEDALKLFPSIQYFSVLLLQAKEGVNCIKEDNKSGGTPEAVLEMASKRGRLNRRAYPWIVPEELERGKKAMKKLKAKFQTNSKVATVSQSTFGSPSHDTYGVFANQDIAIGERILSDQSIFSAINVESDKFCWACCGLLGEIVKGLGYCKAKFCGDPCKAQCLENYHKAMCGKDLRWLYSNCTDADPVMNDMIPLLMLKVLATAVQAGKSPLKVSGVSTLKPDYDSNVPTFWKFQENVVSPIRILQTLGVDIFKDVRFDTWVLQTLFWRIENNKNGTKLGKRVIVSINPMFTMFNHDCDPTTIWGNPTGFGGAIAVSATRKINKGDEICVSYIEQHLPEPKRRERILASIGKLCDCNRCFKERAAAAKGEEPAAFDFKALSDALKEGFNKSFWTL